MGARAFTFLLFICGILCGCASCPPAADRREVLQLRYITSIWSALPKGRYEIVAVSPFYESRCVLLTQDSATHKYFIGQLQQCGRTWDCVFTPVVGNPPGSPGTVAWSPAGCFISTNLVAFRADGQLRDYSKLIQLPRDIVACQLSQDSSQLVILNIDQISSDGSQTFSCACFDLNSQQLVSRVLIGPIDCHQTLVSSLPGGQLVFRDGEVIIFAGGGRIWRWNPKTENVFELDTEFWNWRKFGKQNRRTANWYWATQTRSGIVAANTIGLCKVSGGDVVGLGASWEGVLAPPFLDEFNVLHFILPGDEPSTVVELAANGQWWNGARFAAANPEYQKLAGSPMQVVRAHGKVITLITTRGELCEAER